MMKQRKRKKTSPTFELHRKNIYILPTRSGMMLGVTMLVLLLTSINFQLNLGYALTFLILGASVASVFTAFRTLYGLKFSIHRVTPVFAGEDLLFSVNINNQEDRTRYAIGVSISQFFWNHIKNNWIWTDVLPQEQTRVTLSIPTEKRGWVVLPQLAIETRFPLGVVRAWGIWQPSTKALVYPTAEENPPSFFKSMAQSVDAPETNHTTVIQSRGDEYDAIRPYRQGDPIKQIYWKKVLPSGELLSRETTSTQSADLWFSLESTGLSNLEAQLSRLTSWVLQAHQANISYGLILGKTKIQPHLGDAHQVNCLEALALFQQSGALFEEEH